MKKIDNKYELLSRQLSGECPEEKKETCHDDIPDHHRQTLSAYWNNYFPSVAHETKNRITGNAMLHILGNKPQKSYRMAYWHSAVAILVVSLGISVLWGIFNNSGHNMIQYVANAGEIKNIVLPDGTNVNLNAGSTLIIQEGFKSDKRQVVLLGEGYFDVAKDKRKPFEISTSHLKVSVLGTRFNLKAYPEDQHILASLDEGKIQLKGGFNNEQPVYLNAGQEAIFDKDNGQLNVRDYLKNRSGQWKDGKIIFYSNTLSEIAIMLERKFDVKIVIMDEEVKSYKFSGDFSDAELFELLGYLCAARPFKFSASGNYIIITK